MVRNPPWKRDEVILALDLYFQVNPSHTSDKHPEIIKLSNFLSKLPIHPESQKQTNFRSPDSIYMKLCNFLPFDPSYSGKGLSAGSRLDKLIWDTYCNKIDELHNVAERIRNSSLYIDEIRMDPYIEVREEKPFFEGKTILVLHKLQERNAAVINRKKQIALRSIGALSCEACDFDYYKYYGQIGRGIIECHHNVPVSQIKFEHSVQLNDLSLICSNCHGVIHFSRPWLMVEELREVLIRREKVSNSYPINRSIKLI